MKISSNFDSGNIEVVDAADPTDIKLRIRKDSESDFFQWFHFRATGPADAAVDWRVGAFAAACAVVLRGGAPPRRACWPSR